MDDLKERMKEWWEYDPGHLIPDALSSIEALEARIAKADALADALEAWQTDMFAMRLSHALKVGATLVAYREGSDSDE